jgi:catechol 2,3-dioxygenase-like lactoylglutathione lyase family enzyme
LPGLQRIDHVCLAVSDINKSIAWYTNVLGFEHELGDEPSFGKDPAFMRRDTCCLALLPIAPGGRPVGDRHNGAHLAFGVDRPTFDDWRSRLPSLLEGNGAAADASEVSEEDYGLQLSLFFRDPDRNVLEITTWVDKNDQKRL